MQEYAIAARYQNGSAHHVLLRHHLFHHGIQIGRGVCALQSFGCCGTEK
jgi:hypothetical protein